MSVWCLKCSQRWEDFLLNHPFFGFTFGLCVFAPIMIVLFLLILFQLPFAMIYQLYADSNSNLQKHHKYSKLKDMEQKNRIEISNECVDNASNDRIKISILTYNVFVYFGRFWTRFPLLYSTIDDLSPDISCFQEAINSKWFFFGTQNMVSSIFRKKSISMNTNGMFNCNVFTHISEEFPLLFGKYTCFLWVNFIHELQILMNVYFLVPFLREFLWMAALKYQNNAIYFGWLFLGIPLNYGNCIVFRDNVQLSKDVLLLPGRFTAMRTLYVKKNKRVWIVNTHLSAGGLNNESRNIAEEQLKQCQLILEWMTDAMQNICKADAIIICGDFNSCPDSENYSFMLENGYRSCACEKFGGNTVEQHYCTYESISWTFAKGIDSDVGKIIILDYIWIKGVGVTVDDVQIVGKHFVNAKHGNEDIRIYPSDHYGIFAQISL